MESKIQTAVSITNNSLASIRVLYVDDEISFLKVTKQCLEREEACLQVDIVPSVEEAHKKIKESSYDTIVSDYLMPGKNGLEFLKELRADGNNIPFIVFTGKGREEIAIKALNYGADRYISKSGNPQTVYYELAHSIRQVVRRRRAEKKTLESQEKLRESEKRFRSIVENSFGGIGIVDDNFEIQYINDQVTKILGYSEKEMIGQDFRSFLHGDSKSLIENRYLRRQNGRNVPNHYEFGVIRKDGQRITVEMKVTLIKNDHGGVQTIAEIIDITDRKKAFNTLRESEEKFRNLAEQLPNMIFINKNGKVVYFNKKCMEVMGYTEEEFSSPDFDFHCLIVPESIDRVQSAYKRHSKGEDIAPYEYTLLTKEGRKLEAIITTKLVKYEGENAILGIITDITERKKIEEELRNSEKRLSLLFEFAPDAIYLSDLKGKLIDGNRALEKLTGYKKNELLGKTFSKLELLRGNEKSKERKRLAENSLSKPTDPYEFTIHRKDGQKVSAEMRTFPIKIKGKTLVLGIVHDITERKEKEREINMSQEKFQRLFMGNPEAAVFADTNFRILEINPRFNELFGFSLDEVKGKYINDLVVPKEKMEEAKWLDRNSKKGYFYHSSERKRKDGTLIPVAISAAPIIVEKKLCGHVALYKDISKLKQTEKALKDVGEKLRVVGGLTRHDVRNKLSVIAGNNYLAKKKLSRDKEVLEYFNDNESAIRQIEEIFEFARAYEQLGVEELNYTDVERSFEEAISLVSDTRDVKIKSNCNGLKVIADSLLRYLFYNLIDNSIKHGDKVSRIKLYYKDTGTKLKLVYEDDGVGIPNTKKKVIFSEGYGTDTGYGLFLIKKICEVYRWNIKETGKHGKTAQFTMTIPKLATNGKKNYRV